MSFEKLVFFEALRPEEFGQVIAPTLALTTLGPLESRPNAIDGAKEILIKLHGGANWDWDRWSSHFRAQAVDRLREAVEAGDVVLVAHTARSPLMPAFKKVDGRWQVTRDGERGRARFRFTFHLQRMEQKEKELETLRARDRPIKAEIVESVAGPGFRKATLGPHDNSPLAAAPANQETPITTGLGGNVDQLAAKSPSLQRDLQTLNDSGWEVGYGRAGGGSYADRTSRPPKITIDGAQRSNPRSATQTLAHEVGHATYPYEPDVSSKSAFINGALTDEGAATLNNIKVQREILTNGGPDIGIAGNRANHAAYNKSYDQFLKDGNAQAARESIGKQFGQGEITSNTGQPYAEYYGGWYDKAYPQK